jgi:hypothetical protein
MISLGLMRGTFITVFIFLLISWNSGVKKFPYKNDTINIQQQNECLKDSQPKKDTEEFFGCILYSVPSFETKEWRDYLLDNLVLNSAAVDTIPAGKYTTNIQFEIDDKGKVVNVSIKTDPGYGLGKRAMDIISQYKGQWEWTASPYGRQIKNYRIQPVTFIVEEGEETKDDCKELFPANLIL